VQVGRVPLFVPVNAVPCIPRAQPPWDRVRLGWAQGFRLRDPFVRVAVQVRPRAVPDSGTFLGV